MDVFHLMAFQTEILVGGFHRLNEARNLKPMDQIQKLKVLLLRSEFSGLDKYAAILQEFGCEVYNVPTLDFVYQNLDTLEGHLNNVSQYAGIVFTSPRGVLATSEVVSQHHKSLWRNKPCFVVGEKTGSLVVEKLGLSHIGSESGNAASLADVITKELTDKSLPLLFPCGNLKKETLPNKLEDAGIQLQSCTVYSTVQHPELTSKLVEYLRMRPDFAVFFSPSGVNFSQEIMKCADCFEQMKHVSIGPTTKQALEKCGMKVFACAAKPCPEAICDIIKGT